MAPSRCDAIRCFVWDRCDAIRCFVWELHRLLTGFVVPQQPLLHFLTFVTLSTCPTKYPKPQITFGGHKPTFLESSFSSKVMFAPQQSFTNTPTSMSPLCWFHTGFFIRGLGDTATKEGGGIMCFFWISS